MCKFNPLPHNKWQTCITLSFLRTRIVVILRIWFSRQVRPGDQCGVDTAGAVLIVSNIDYCHNPVGQVTWECCLLSNPPLHSASPSVSYLQSLHPSPLHVIFLLCHNKRIKLQHRAHAVGYWLPRNHLPHPSSSYCRPLHPKHNTTMCTWILKQFYV